MGFYGKQKQKTILPTPASGARAFFVRRTSWPTNCNNRAFKPRLSQTEQRSAHGRNMIIFRRPT
jgi:hypothetical protein